MGGTLRVKEMFFKFYVCDACGTRCYFCATNDHGSLPCPTQCPYDCMSDADASDQTKFSDIDEECIDLTPNWRVLEEE